MDCLEYMRNIPDKFFDLAIADPPYGINVTKMTLGNGKKKKFIVGRKNGIIPHLPMNFLNSY